MSSPAMSTLAFSLVRQCPVLQFQSMGFGVTGIYIIITKPTYSTGSHNVIIVLVKFLLKFVFIIIDMLDGNRGR